MPKRLKELLAMSEGEVTVWFASERKIEEPSPPRHQNGKPVYPLDGLAAYADEWYEAVGELVEEQPIFSTP